MINSHINILIIYKNIKIHLKWIEKIFDDKKVYYNHIVIIKHINRII